MTAIASRLPNVNATRPLQTGRAARLAALVIAAACVLVGAAGWGPAAVAEGAGAAREEAQAQPGAHVQAQAGGVEQPILVEAETTEYHYGPGGTVVEAFGNVRATSGDLALSADYVRIDVEPGQVLARGGVEFQRGTSTTRCALFSYNLNTREGRVLDPDVHVPGVHVRGSEMDIEPSRFALSDAHVTGCELDGPCYRVTAARVIVYPDERVVMEQPVLWLEAVPVLALPRLSLPVKGDRVGWVEGEGYPVPRVAYNPDDGLVIGLSYLDRSREALDLRYEGAYLSGRAGIQLQLDADAHSVGGAWSATVIGGYRSWEGLYASAKWRTALSGTVAVEADACYDPERATWEDPAAGGVSAPLTVRGLEGGLGVRVDTGPVLAKLVARKDLGEEYGAVWSLPAAEVSTDPIKVPGLPVTLAISGGAGRFEEPAQDVLARRTFATILVGTQPLRLADGVSLTLSHEAGQAWYSTGDVRRSSTTTAHANLDLGTVDAFGTSVPAAQIDLGYVHTEVSGDTPFAFDAVEPLDDAEVGASVRLGPGWTAGVVATYDIAGGALKDLDFAVVSHHHCYDVQATWREVRREFGLEVRFLR